ncbi:MAG: hypothetical protein H0U55_00630 [Rubrobacteraceae bacterium]|nr:hypothetical protein [Rubrobacteraceae bacterium]
MRLNEVEQAWEIEADSFARRFGGLRPVRLAQDVLILERRPVLISVGYALVRKIPVDVVVTAYPHRTPLATHEEVAADYGKALSAAGLACDERRTGHLSYASYNRRLVITIRPGTVTERVAITDGVTGLEPSYRSDEASFPHPDFVGAFCTALVKTASTGGQAADLPTRSRGGAPKAENLIPACVAFLLKEHGIQPDKKINGLLDDHVLNDGWKRSHSERSLFKYALKGTSLHQQVWDNSRKKAVVRDPLIDAAWTLFWEGYEE